MKKLMMLTLSISLIVILAGGCVVGSGKKTAKTLPVRPTLTAPVEKIEYNGEIFVVMLYDDFAAVIDWYWDILRSEGYEPPE